MRFDIHIHLHTGEDMTKLTDAVEALTAEATDTVGKLQSLEATVRGFPAVVGAAVAQALADANVADDEAADAVTAATQAISDEVDNLLAAADANNPPAGEPAPAPSGGDSPAPVSDAPAPQLDSGGQPL